MTDWDTIIEQIRRAMEMVDEAHQASENLQNNVTATNVDAFTRQVNRLRSELGSIQWALDHPGQVSMDEVVDALNRLFSGKSVGYRTSPPVDFEHPSK
jgi:hypothetical protein